ncbi:zinc-binding dehydrogenase [Halorarius halobius]|uniref:zinc-binding dehydrogenase n=1 Tax=Halorarius halobius TaxID=2962671 RepID=UPI0020CB7CC7|nr:zinc-binding dehydrogenase [Halorarius halobius]
MASETMAAVLLTEHGDVDALDYRTDVPVPEPAPNELLVDVAACGLNNTDVWTREAAYDGGDGGWSGDVQFPLVQGADVCGTVVEVGDRVDAERLGDRVVVDPALPGDGDDEFRALSDAAFLGSERDGGFAEYVTVPAANAHRVESDRTDAELAAVPTAYATAERMLNRGGVATGDTLLVTGASGGVGTGLVQLARRRDATVVAVTSSPHADGVRELGADHVVRRDEEPVVDGVESRVGAVDAVADVVGGDLFRPLLERLRPGGRHVVAGAVAGPVVDIDLRPLYLEHRSVVGSSMWTRSEFRDVLGYVETGALDPVLAETFDLAELPAAQRRFTDGEFLGKLVVEP